MAKTLNEIAISVLKKLGKLPDGQVPEETHIKTVEDAYSGLYDELLGDSLVNWSETDDIPEFAVFPVTTMLLAMVADDFGRPDKWSVNYEFMRRRLAQSLAPPYVHQPTQFEDM